MEFYDGTKLLSLKDINGEEPEIYMCVGNRTAGKTTYFTRLLINRFKRSYSKCAFLYRYNYEIRDCVDKIFKDVHGLFFPNDNLKSEIKARGIYTELFLNEKSFGYAISLNAAENIKKLSHLFTDVQSIFFDEFQSETNSYCDNEINKFISVHTSIARGNGKQYRPVPVYMASNAVSLINPYFTTLGISNRINVQTKFLKGDGFVLEQNFNQNAAELSQNAAFNRAFSNSKYLTYASQNVYLNDNSTFIATPKGKNTYICTLKYNGNEFGVRSYDDEGIIYCDKRPDKTFKHKISVSLNDHDLNYVMLKKNDYFVSLLRWYFDRGCFRFKDLLCKEVILKTITY